MKIKYKKIPKSKGKGFCDDLWADLVKLRDGNECSICGSVEMINAHHLISRRVHKYRWVTDNGISVCPSHHEFSLELSAHTAPWGLEEWMKNNRPEQYKIWVKNRSDVSADEMAEYDELYYNLEKQYKTTTGNYFRIERIAPYILFLNFEEIKNLLLVEPSANDNRKIAVVVEKMKEYSIGSRAVSEFLKANKLIQR